MKNIGLGLSMLRPVRFLIVVFTCALLIFSYAFPAAAIGTQRSNPEKGEAQLLETQKKTDEVTAKPPLGLKETTERANEGLNEVQGAADINKMNRPENSQQATSAEEQVENFLEKITGKK
ncbi:hypothetical protein [Brasilonema bromeliae]|uniref:Low temperature-induced protein n=1 Tax=Brasilonema bromeliae SPC951 TaxID=385972 RepID=A0ABX1PBU2_9CYAN|nr:hypothetical protein [Brasilonema bromeliae]NMG21942.1 hypothetical protein [Brasilonema bromeliae SPC951]